MRHLRRPGSRNPVLRGLPGLHAPRRPRRPVPPLRRAAHSDRTASRRRLGSPPAETPEARSPPDRPYTENNQGGAVWSQALVQRRAGPSHGLADGKPLAGLPEGPGGVLAALVAVKPDPNPGSPECRPPQAVTGRYDRFP